MINNNAVNIQTALGQDWVVKGECKSPAPATRLIRVSAAELVLRGIAVGRRNYLFADAESGGAHAAAMSSLSGTAKLNEIDPEGCLRHVLANIADHPVNRVDDFLPRNFL